MSKPNLPNLPPGVRSVEIVADGRAEYREAWATYYTMTQMTAYAEEAVRQALAAQAPLAHELPHWEEISAKKERGEALTPLELFVYENEPAGDSDDWRDQLTTAIALASVSVAEPETMEEIHRRERDRSPWRLPKDPTLDMLEALRTGSRKDWPSDELCRVRYAALRTAALAAPQET